MKKYQILLSVASVLVAGFSPTKILAQGTNGVFPDTKITCSAPSLANGGVVDMGEIADPASVNVPVQTVLAGFDCMSWQFQQQSQGIYEASGAVCLAIDVPSGSASMRKLTHKTDPNAGQINFNFSHSGSISAAEAVGDANGNGVGVTTLLWSAATNSSPSGPPLAVGGNTNDLAVYIHQNGQPANLPSGEYEGDFTWKLYAGTADVVMGPPRKENCATQVGQGAVATGVIKVKVTVKLSCSLTLMANNLFDFGKVTTNELVAGVGPITRNIEIKCNNNKDMIVTMGAGQNSNGLFTSRHMKLDGGTELLRYSLTKPGGGEWGDDTTTGYHFTGNIGATHTIPVEGRILPHSGTVPTGFYRDHVHVQLWN